MVAEGVVCGSRLPQVAQEGASVVGFNGVGHECKGGIVVFLAVCGLESAEVVGERVRNGGFHAGEYDIHCLCAGGLVILGLLKSGVACGGKEVAPCVFIDGCVGNAGFPEGDLLLVPREVVLLLYDTRHALLRDETGRDGCCDDEHQGACGAGYT